MRINTLRIQNFRGYVDQEFHLHPEFNLVIGANGTGKTSFLEAAAVAVGSWFLGIRGHDSRNIWDRDVRVIRELVEKRYRELPQYPVKIEAKGFIQIARVERSKETGEISYVPAVNGKNDAPNPEEVAVDWSRSVEGAKGHTTRAGANKLKSHAEWMARTVMSQKPVILPIIRYFGAGRLWETVRDSDSTTISKHKGKQPAELAEDASLIDEILHENDRLSEPFYGYRLSVDKRCNPHDLIRWMAYERRNELDEDEKSPVLKLVYRAIEGLLPEIASARYSTKLRTLVLHGKDGQRHTFKELSDGYRNIVAIAADLAIKAAMLNPQLAEKALVYTPGVVLIDELDLHLHPNWQRRVIEDLRRTFPLVQFICTTHSPFLIQSLRSGEEMIVLDNEPIMGTENLPVEDISRGIMGVENPETSLRYAKLKEVAKHFLETLEEAVQSPPEKLEAYKQRLAEAIGPYSDNPAFQAFLEMKKTAKLGE